MCVVRCGCGIWYNAHMKTTKNALVNNVQINAGNNAGINAKTAWLAMLVACALGMVTLADAIPPAGSAAMAEKSSLADRPDAASAGTQGAESDEIARKCPVSEKCRGHENIDWSISYGFHLVDEQKDLPRVLLVGDSICNGYQGRVMARLEGKVNVSFWASSYCVTSSNYLQRLALQLEEAKFDVVHFNNGLHSLQTPTNEYERAYRDALELVRRRAPGAAVVWATSTPMRGKRDLVVAVNAAASRSASGFADIAKNDLFALMDPFGRDEMWSDDCHFKPKGYDLLAGQVADAVLAALSSRRR